MAFILAGYSLFLILDTMIITKLKGEGKLVPYIRNLRGRSKVIFFKYNVKLIRQNSLSLNRVTSEDMTTMQITIRILLNKNINHVKITNLRNHRH